MGCNLFDSFKCLTSYRNCLTFFSTKSVYTVFRSLSLGKSKDLPLWNKPLWRQKIEGHSKSLKSTLGNTSHFCDSFLNGWTLVNTYPVGALNLRLIQILSIVLFQNISLGKYICNFKITQWGVTGLTWIIAHHRCLQACSQSETTTNKWLGKGLHTGM